jgi:hypothetical protein
MLTYQDVETLVRQDFEAFTPAIVEPIAQYHKIRHICMATQIILVAFSNKTCYMMSDVHDMIHALNHLFFFGLACGRSMEETN